MPKSKIIKIISLVSVLGFITYYTTSPSFRQFLLQTFAKVKDCEDIGNPKKRIACRLGITGSPKIKVKTCDDIGDPKKRAECRNATPAPNPYPVGPAGSCFSDYSGQYYSNGSTVLLGTGVYYKCKDGNFVSCTDCKLTDLTEVPTYLKEEYDKEKRKEASTPNPADLAREERTEKKDCESQGWTYDNGYCIPKVDPTNFYNVAKGEATVAETELVKSYCQATMGGGCDSDKIEEISIQALGGKENFNAMLKQEAMTDANNALQKFAQAGGNYTFSDSEKKAVQQLCFQQNNGPSMACQDLNTFSADYLNRQSETAFNTQLQEIKDQKPDIDISEITYNPSSLSPIGSSENPYSNVLNPEFNQTVADYENKSYGKEYAMCQDKQNARERYVCNQNIDNLEKALASAPLGIAGYVESNKPIDNSYYYWSRKDYNTLKDCKTNESDPEMCGKVSVDIYKERLTSSITLGTNLTILAGIPVISAPAIIAGYGAGGIVGAGVATLGQMGVLSTVNQTSVTANAWIEDPGSTNTWIQTGNMALSWANLSTVDMISKASGILNTTQKAINTGVSGANFVFDSYNVSEYCFGENYDPLNCAMNVGAVAFDVGGGLLDFNQNQLLWSKQADINPPKINVDAPKIDVHDPNGSRYISPNQMDDMALAMTSVVQSDTVPTIELSKTRPADIQTAIDRSFDELQNSIKDLGIQPHVPGYLTEGGPSDYTFGQTSATRIIDLKASTNNNELAILDIGAASGGLVENVKNLHPEINVTALSASDYRTSSNPLTGINYYVGNAENIVDIYPLNTFDIIISNYTFTHFADPLGSIEQAYKTLKPNGLLIIDDFDIIGIDDPKSVFNILKSQGYNIVVDFNQTIDPLTLTLKNNSIKFLAIEKVSENLSFPVKYASLNSEGKVVYELTKNLQYIEQPPLPQAVIELLNTKGVKYSGDPIMHFEDFISDNNFSQQQFDVLKIRRLELQQSQITNAISSGATPAELLALRDVHTKINNGIDAFQAFKKMENIDNDKAITSLIGQTTNSWKNLTASNRIALAIDNLGKSIVKAITTSLPTPSKIWGAIMIRLQPQKLPFVLTNTNVQVIKSTIGTNNRYPITISSSDKNLVGYLGEISEYLKPHKNLTTTRKVSLISAYVNQTFPNYNDPLTKDVNSVLNQLDIISKKTGNVVGDFIENECAVCKQQSIILHIVLANEGIPSSIVTGQIGIEGGEMGHVFIIYKNSDFNNELWVTDPTWAGLNLKFDDAIDIYQGFPSPMVEARYVLPMTNSTIDDLHYLPTQYLYQPESFFSTPLKVWDNIKNWANSIIASIAKTSSNLLGK